MLAQSHLERGLPVARAHRARRVMPVRSRPMRVWVGAGVTGAVLVASLMFSLTHPAVAGAEVPVIGPAVKAIGGGIHTVLHPAEAVVEALVSILRAIFGGVEAKLITAVINGLLATPNFDTGHVAALEHTTVAISAGMLSAVLTLSILRYYLAGLSDSSSGGFEAVQGLVRVIGAVGFIIAWPGIFSELVQIPKMFDAALLGDGSVQHNVALLFDAALVVGSGAFAINAGLGLIFVVLIGFIAAIVFIALLWMKVLLSVMMMFLYVSMPLCVVLWPVQELSWLASSAMRAMFVALIVPCVWAILFALSAAVNADVLTWAPSHSVIDTVIIRPLAGITLMLLCITIPRFLMRTAMVGPHGQVGGGWRVWRTVTFGMFAMRGAAGVGRTVATAAVEGQPVAKRMIDALPTQLRPPTEPGTGSLAGRVIFGQSGHSKNTQSQAQTSDPTGNRGMQDARIRPEMQLPGIDPASNDRERINRAGEDMYAQAGTSPSSATAVTTAMGRLPEQTQRAIAAFRTNDHLKLRDLMAHNLHSPSLSQDQHEALWTIGTAQNNSAKQGISAAIDNLDQAESKDPQSTAVQASSSPPPQAEEPQAGTTPPGGRPAAPLGSDGRPSGSRTEQQGPLLPGSGADAPRTPPLQGPPSSSPESSEGDGRSLGTDLPQQPPPPPRATRLDQGAPPDPFLED